MLCGSNFVAEKANSHFSGGGLTESSRRRGRRRELAQKEGKVARKEGSRPDAWGGVLILLRKHQYTENFFPLIIKKM